MLQAYFANMFFVVIATLGFITVYSQINAGTSKRVASQKSLSHAQRQLPLLIYLCVLLLLLNLMNTSMQGWLYWAFLNLQVVILVYANLLVPTLVDLIVVQAVGISLFIFSGTLTTLTLPPYLIACLVVFAERWYGPLLRRHRVLYLLPSLAIGAAFWLVAWLTAPHAHPLSPALAVVNFIGFAWAYLALWDYDRYQQKDQQVLAALTREVQFDGLTHARNWTMFQRDFNAAYASGDHLALIALDLDHFKHINDTYGHLVGNQALMMVSSQLQAYLGEVDPRYRLYRTGGEEFAVVLPQTDSLQANAIVFGCQARLRAATVRFSDGEFKLSASFGMAIATPADGNATAVFKRADTYLYRSKQHGRDCVTIEGQTIAA